MAQVTDKDAQQWEERVRQFAQTHPDYNQVLDAAVKRGLYLSRAHAAEMVRLKSPETIYYLAKPENEAEARMVFNSKDGEYLNPELAADKVRRLHSRIVRNDTFRTIEEKPDEVATYLAKRKEDFKSGKRRRR